MAVTMTRDQTLQQASAILVAMYRASVPTVAELAHALHDLAKKVHLEEVADASTVIERAAINDNVVSLTQPLSRLSAALAAVAQQPAA
jgi:HPt (histidine-containing phosphotransfer) domain-containing protein